MRRRRNNKQSPDQRTITHRRLPLSGEASSDGITTQPLQTRERGAKSSLLIKQHQVLCVAFPCKTGNSPDNPAPTSASRGGLAPARPDVKAAQPEARTARDEARQHSSARVIRI